MRVTIGLLFAILLTATQGWADALQIQLDSPTLTAAPGDTVTFRCVILNQSGFVVDLNSINVTLNGMFTVDATPFFLGPVSVGAPPDPAQTVDFELFSVTVDLPYTDLPGIQSGTVTILGNVETNGTPDTSVLDPLGSATFGINVTTGVPEPSTLAAMLAALAAGAVVRSLRRKQKARTSN